MKWYSVWQDDGWITSYYESINTPAQLQEVFQNRDGPIGLVFWGGEDIASEIYNARPTHPQVPYRMSARDFCETEVFKYAVKMHIPMVGICRGAQLLNVLCGGGLTQHVEGHNHSSHDIHMYDSKGILRFTNDEQGDHHQQMIYKTGLLMGYHMKGDILEPEIIFHEKDRVLCIQSHPEWCEGSNFETLCKQLVKELLE